MKSDTFVSEEKIKGQGVRKRLFLLSDEEDEIKEKETKLGSYQSNHFSEPQIPSKATILLIWCQMSLKCSYPRRMCFGKNKESNTFKDWERFSSIYQGL